MNTMIFIVFYIISNIDKMSDEHFTGWQSTKWLPRRMIKQMKYKMKQIPHKLEEIQAKEAKHDIEKKEADNYLETQLAQEK